MLRYAEKMCHNGATERTWRRAQFRLELLSSQTVTGERPPVSDLAAGLLSVRSSSSEENDLPPAAFCFRSDSLRRILPPGLPGGRTAPEHPAAERRCDPPGGHPSAPALPAFLGGTMIPAPAFPRVQGSSTLLFPLLAGEGRREGRQAREARYSHRRATPLLGGSPVGIETL